jgi:acyl carrier protein
VQPPQAATVTPAAQPAKPPAATPTALPPASPAPAASNGLASIGQVEQFLVNFVVEQTGYAPAVVRMDSDLEADLGIDSIKKARLFGELREYFDLQPDASLTLDSFPTLGTIRDYLAKKMGGAAPAPAAVQPTAAPAPLVAARQATVAAPQVKAAAPVPPPPVLPTPFVPAQPAPAAVLKPAFAPTAVAAPAAAAAPAARTSSLDPQQLQAFLVNFVVEQTGYAPAVVRMDADLEADLGIDSIKKARLFGELREYFDVQPDPTVTLDSFPTLGHIRDYLLKR